MARLWVRGGRVTTPLLGLVHAYGCCLQAMDRWTDRAAHRAFLEGEARRAVALAVHAATHADADW